MAPTALVYKILSTAEWQAAFASGFYAGSADDSRDGFIHLSTREQVAETAARHFRGRPDLVLVALDTDRLGPKLRWEPSRGGALFPHLYDRLDVAAHRAAWPMPLSADGVPTPPADLGEDS